MGTEWMQFQTCLETESEKFVNSDWYQAARTWSWLADSWISSSKQCNWRKLENSSNTSKLFRTHHWLIPLVSWIIFIPVEIISQRISCPGKLPWANQWPESFPTWHQELVQSDWWQLTKNKKPVCLEKIGGLNAARSEDLMQHGRKLKEEEAYTYC